MTGERHSEAEDVWVIQAMITCPTTGKVVPAGMVFGTLQAFDQTILENNSVQCAACGQPHLVDNSTVKVFPSEPEPQHLSGPRVARG